MDVYSIYSFLIWWYIKKLQVNALKTTYALISMCHVVITLNIMRLP